jgi:DNA-3-methyladenine glycosylase I
LWTTGVCLKRSASAASVSLSWLTILNKREGFRAAFAQFDAEQVAAFDQADVERLVQDAIVRHRGKIESTINARRVLELRREFGSLARYVWQYEPARPTGLRC